MDSVTQIALGAAVSEAVMQNKVGAGPLYGVQYVVHYLIWMF